MLSRDLNRQGIYPPINVLPSLSRLMKDGIGKEQTRSDHAGLSDQLYAAYAHVQEVRAMADIIGEEELSGVDKDYLTFGEDFETRFIAQGEKEMRDVTATLDLGWEVLRRLPVQELTRVSEEEIRTHYSGGKHHG